MDEKTKLSRRSFLKTGLAGAAAAATAVSFPAIAAETKEGHPLPNECTQWSWEKPVKPIPDKQIKNTVTSDVVVIGAGLSGIAAALSAAEFGAKVQLMEKNSTWAARGGHITAFDSTVQKRMGIKNDYRQIIRDWIAWAQGRVDERLLWNFAEKAGACMDWAVGIGERYGLKVTMWEGYYKGPDYTEYPVTHFFHEENADLSYVYGNSTGIGNVTLVPALEKEAKSKGVVFNYGTPAVQILKDSSGKVTGLIAGKQGKYTKFLAPSVIIATGDYASNNEMKKCFSPFSLKADAQIYFPNKCNTGDGLIMAMQAGGSMQRHEPHAAVIHLEAGAASYGFLHVNAEGRRFKNEDVNTQSKSCTKELEPEGIAWTIYDRDGLTEVKKQVDANLGGGLFYGQMWQPWGKGFNLEVEKMTQEAHIKDGKVLVANTIEELARKMNVPVANFTQTVKRYNELYAMQDDPDYGKRKELLTPIINAPFYAGKLASTLLTMCGGLRTDSRLLVLDGKGEPIPGLYVVGAAQGEFFANDYPTICPGIGHGRCLTFGRMAGIKAAGKDPYKVIPSIKI
ncbi:MAG: FAD-binding protein [Geovibrio sp.]|nr:FAD-binding protein [Geovibrio sp.]